MKIQSLIFLFLCTCLAGFAQKAPLHYTIEGQIKNCSSGEIYFAVFGPSGERDSAEIKNGNFRFTGTLAEPSPVILSLEPNFVNKPLFMFFVGRGQHTVTLDKDHLRDGRASGSAATRDYALLKTIERPFNDRFSSLFERARKDTSKTVREAIQKSRNALLQRRDDAYLAFIRSHPSSPVAAWVAHRYFLNSDDLEKVYEMLSPALHYTSFATRMKDKIEINKRLSAGRVAPDFMQNDPSGKPVSLSDFRGKYVLLDFWASWCGPCRAENPNVVKAYNKYKDKGFTVLGVSLDSKAGKWKKAIADDHLAWMQVSDLKGWENEAARQYGINAIPSNYLIDPEGTIIGHDLRGDKLEEKLAEVIK